MPTATDPVYVIGHITVKDHDAWARYRAAVGATVTSWGGKTLLRGQPFEVFAGPHPFTDVVVISFPDADVARDWHDSPEYQALVPLRQQAADVVLVGFAAPTS